MRARILTTQLLAGATLTGAGSTFPGYPGIKTFEAVGRTTAGAGAATVQIRGRNSAQAGWQVIGTITLTLSASGGTNDAADGFLSEDRYAEVSANVTAISGTGATVDASMGY
jgi:hypothetical protein